MQQGTRPSSASRRRRVSHTTMSVQCASASQSGVDGDTAVCNAADVRHLALGGWRDGEWCAMSPRQTDGQADRQLRTERRASVRYDMTSIRRVGPQPHTTSASPSHHANRKVAALRGHPCLWRRRMDQSIAPCTILRTLYIHSFFCMRTTCIAAKLCVPSKNLLREWMALCHSFRE